jgi:hypothetical protein
VDIAPVAALLGDPPALRSCVTADGRTALRERLGIDLGR